MRLGMVVTYYSGFIVVVAGPLKYINEYVIIQTKPLHSGY